MFHQTYEVVGQLGEGISGSVIHAKRLSDGVSVAVKLLRKVRKL